MQRCELPLGMNRSVPRGGHWRELFCVGRHSYTESEKTNKKKKGYKKVEKTKKALTYIGLYP
jgi:hypothetical protein